MFAGGSNVESKMSRAMLPGVILFATLCAVSCTTDPPSRGLPPGNARSNVILIVVDTLRKDHLGAYGYLRPTSPNIDRLASESMRYTRCFSQAPWTTPSVGALLTSLYPSRLAIRDIPNALDDEFELLPEMLQRSGYVTGGIVSHEFLGSRWNFDQGFDEFHDDLAGSHDSVSSPDVTDRAISFVERRATKPFFLFVHYFDPHHLYLPHEGFRFEDSADYNGPLSPEITPRQLNRLPQDAIGDGEVRYLKALYDSEVAFTDHHLGRLLDDLRKRGLYEDALIVFTSDHGEEFFDHRGFGHTTTLYDELINVPLLIKLPGRTDGSVSHRTVALIDVLPTILEILDLPPPSGLDGRSLLALDSETEERTVMSETSRGEALRAVIQGPMKLIHDLILNRTVLFDLQADPGEQHDLAGSGMEREPLLREALDRWLELEFPGGGRPRRVQLSEEDQKRLRALGYVE